MIRDVGYGFVARKDSRSTHQCLDRHKKDIHIITSDLVIRQIKMTADRYILRDFTKIGHPVGLG
jgi:hypothetical protein